MHNYTGNAPLSTRREAGIGVLSLIFGFDVCAQACSLGKRRTVKLRFRTLYQDSGLEQSAIRNEVGIGCRGYEQINGVRGLHALPVSAGRENTNILHGICLGDYRATTGLPIRCDAIPLVRGAADGGARRTP